MAETNTAGVPQERGQLSHLKGIGPDVGLTPHLPVDTDLELERELQAHVRNLRYPETQLDSLAWLAESYESFAEQVWAYPIWCCPAHGRT